MLWFLALSAHMINFKSIAVLLFCWYKLKNETVFHFVATIWKTRPFLFCCYKLKHEIVFQVVDATCKWVTANNSCFVTFLQSWNKENQENALIFLFPILCDKLQIEWPKYTRTHGELLDIEHALRNWVQKMYKNST